MILSHVIAVAVICTSLLPAGAWGQAATKPSKTDLDRRSKSASRLGRIARHGDRAVALYPDRLEFFGLTPKEGIDNQGNFTRGNEKRAPKVVEPEKLMWFSRPFNMQEAGGNFLVCTAGWLPKTSGPGPSDFCGIVTAEGTVVYRFPFQQKSPTSILMPLAISEDGKYAEVWVGRIVQGEDGAAPGAPREVLAWRHPDRLSRFAGPWKSGEPDSPALSFDSLLQGFKERKKAP